MKTNLKRLEGEQSFRDYVRGLCIETSHSAVANKYGLSLSHLSNIIHGYGTVGPSVAQRFGYQKLRTFAFVPIRKG